MCIFCVLHGATCERSVGPRPRSLHITREVCARPHGGPLYLMDATKGPLRGWSGSATLNQQGQAWVALISFGALSVLSFFIALVDTPSSRPDASVMFTPGMPQAG